MKKLITIFTLAVMLFTGCSGTNSDKPVNDNTANNEIPSETTASPDKSSSSKTPQYEVIDSAATIWGDSIGTTWVQVISEVKNTGNASLYLSAGSFDLENEAGELVDTMQFVSVYPQIIKPGETAVYCNQTTSDKLDSKVNLKVIPHIKADAAKKEQIVFPATEVKVTNEKYGGIAATGRIENNTNDAQEMVYVSVICRDENNKVLAVLFTILTNSLQAGEKIGFEAKSLSLPKDLTAEKVKSFETYAYPLQMQF